MRVIIKTNLNFYYRHLEQKLQCSKNTTHSCVFKSHIYFEPTEKKSLGAKDKIPSYNINDSACQENHNAPKKKMKNVIYYKRRNNDTNKSSFLK